LIIIVIILLAGRQRVLVAMTSTRTVHSVDLCLLMLTTAPAAVYLAAC